MAGILDFLSGKKTYLIAFIGATVGLAQAIWPEFVVPEWANYILAALGLGALRAAAPPK